MVLFRYLPLAGILLLAGCLPSSCQREQPRALFPADSLSRQLATETPEDTLAIVWQAYGSDELPLGYPRTIRYDGKGLLYVSDPEHDRIARFDLEGNLVDAPSSPTFKFSFLAGIRGDTALVFNPEASHVDYLTDGNVVYQTPTPSDLPGRNRVQYVTADDEAIYFKLLGDNFAGYIARIDREGNVTHQTPLEGALARHAGPMRIWGDSLMSFTAFHPMADVLSKELQHDSLRLHGFDSPMLARTRAFVLGEQQEPPLLSASAAPAGDYLFALNMRPGWLQVDVFDRQGTLVRRLIQENPEYGKNFYPIDLDAWQAGSGEWMIAVAVVEPRPTVALLSWREGG